MEIFHLGGRKAYSHWLRTGQLPAARTSDGIELKFNPYHDPRNGQFTFAPGGPRSLSNVIVSRGHRQEAAPKRSASSMLGANRPIPPNDVREARLSDAVYRPENNSGWLKPVSFPRMPRISRGSNINAFQDPMTLLQIFPGLQNKPAGAIVALADNVLDLQGPARELTAEVTRNWSDILINQIKTIDPNYRFESLGFPTTLQGQINQLNTLRFERAAAFLKQKNEFRPMQVETLRFIQATVDQAYEEGKELLKVGKLKIRLSREEALGNFIDRRVRTKLHERYNMLDIDSAGKGPVRVNRRENDTSGTESTFRRPDARVGNIAYDVTLANKTLKTQQIRGFFNADFKPSYVIIIRPRQLGLGSSYVITRPETK